MSRQNIDDANRFENLAEEEKLSSALHLAGMVYGRALF
jgi:hypothetical protein